MVPKIINKYFTFKNKGWYNNQIKFHKFLNSIENANYVWKYCVKSEMEMMRHEGTKLVFPSFNQNVGFTVSLTSMTRPFHVFAC